MKITNFDEIKVTDLMKTRYSVHGPALRAHRGARGHAAHRAAQQRLPGLQLAPAPAPGEVPQALVPGRGVERDAGDSGRRDHSTLSSSILHRIGVHTLHRQIQNPYMHSFNPIPSLQKHTLRIFE